MDSIVCGFEASVCSTPLSGLRQMQDVLFGENLRNPPRWRFIASNPGALADAATPFNGFQRDKYCGEVQSSFLLALW